MDEDLFVLVGVDTSGPEPLVTRFGPTSPRPDLLARFDMRWPVATDRVVVVPVMEGALLRVSKRDLKEALAE